MHIWGSLLELLESEMTTPTSYGWFHLMFIFIMIAVCVLMCTFFRNSSERTVRRIVAICWIIFLVLEIYKQIIYTLEYDGGVIVSDYQWYAFPYQLCSTPMYVLPFVAFLKDGRLRDAAIAYTVAFSIFGGLCVYAYPGDVFIATIGINIQTMIHHGMQIVIGVYLASCYRHRLNFKYFLGGGAVFLVLLAIALASNIGVYHALRAVGNDETFNMFYIGPYFDCTLPVLSSIYPKVPYIVFLLLYAVGFTVAAFVIFCVTKLTVNLLHRARVNLGRAVGDEA